MVLSAVLLSMYFCSLLSLSFVGHPVVYCVLLVQGALSISGYVFLVLGVSWYLVLFCLVYVGGVYILFIFVSLYSPNSFPYLGSVSENGVSVGFVLLCVVFVWGTFSVGDWAQDSSHYLCSNYEGFSYCLFCLVLIFGFFLVSVVNGSKDSFFR